MPSGISPDIWINSGFSSKNLIINKWFSNHIHQYESTTMIIFGRAVQLSFKHVYQLKITTTD